MGRRRLRECKDEKEEEEVDDDEEDADEDVGYANVSWTHMVFLSFQQYN